MPPIAMAGVCPHVFKCLNRMGIIDAIGKDNIFPARRLVTASFNEAVAQTQD